MKITYLLGAGASANCLPIINQINSRLENLKSILSGSNVLRLIEPQVPSIKHRNPSITIREKLISEIDWLISECGRHKTVDTVAKKFYLRSERHKDLIKLKRVLNVYFVFEQTYKTQSQTVLELKSKEIPDKRYDSFIASIIGTEINNLKLPNNLNIITWNYDVQFEIALKEYNGKSIPEIQAEIQAIPSRINSIEDNNFNQDKFSLIRLNGVAGLGGIKSGGHIYENTIIDTLFEVNNEAEYWNRLLDYYSNMIESTENYLVHDSGLFNYSWEDNDSFKDSVYPTFRNTREKAEEIFKKTEILVIIGYSFPFFNREVDMSLFKQLDYRKVQKIYIQDPNFNSIRDKTHSYIRAANNNTAVRLEHSFFNISYLDQFVIPDEF